MATENLKGPALTVWAGLDVGKEHFVAALCPERTPGQSPPAPRELPTAEFARSAAGVRAWLKWVRQQRPKVAPGAASVGVRIVMEATGNYSRELAEWLGQLAPEWPAAISEPRRVAQYLQGVGLRGKTDPTDACGLARYGAECWPPPYVALPPVYAELRALTRERQSVVEAQVAGANRAATTGGAGSCRAVARLQRQRCAYLARQVAKLEGLLREHVQRHPELRQTVAHLTSIPGVGFLTAVVFLAEAGWLLPHFPTVRQFVAWCGLDPVPYDSGKSVHGKAHLSKHGSAHLRRSLYLAALALTRKPDCALGSTYARLVRAGKPGLVALGAVMRKLAVLMRALLKHDADYCETIPVAAQENSAMTT